MARKERTVLCGIARDEDRYIVEWVAYHLSLGFDHVYLYDNMSVRPITDLLSLWVLNTRVTVIRWPSIPGINAQIAAYDHFLNTYGKTADWAAVLDLDEFLNLKVDKDVSTFLARFSYPAADAVAVNWRMFGSSGESVYRKVPMVERFTRASALDFPPNGLVKTIFRPRSISAIHQHSAAFNPGVSLVSPAGRPLEPNPLAPLDPDAFATAQVNHYFTKSRAEWVQKNIRGYTDQTLREHDDFERYDRNEELDLSIAPHVAAMRRAMIWTARRPWKLGQGFMRATFVGQLKRGGSRNH